ncbi:hypothetical protein ATO13_07775 [Stappia sp. 22II-S9-Z10]|nr:hypothetical protein ATO13_07775 [Stappia sp. 22II-S9-Z10]
MLSTKKFGILEPNLECDVGIRGFFTCLDHKTCLCRGIDQFFGRFLGGGFVHIVKRINHLMRDFVVRPHQDLCEPVVGKVVPRHFW